MKILDFSSNQFDELNPDVIWEKNILRFLEDWDSSDEYITTQTSGSTGVPKKIKIPKEAMRKSAKLTGGFFQFQKGQSALLCLPTHFIAGKMMLVRALEFQLRLICVEPSSFVDLKTKSLFDFVAMTPMQVQSSLKILPQIKNLLIGGAPLSSKLKDQLLLSQTNCYESYGMTETVTHIALKEISEYHFTALQGVVLSQDSRECLVIQTPYFKDKVVTNDVVELFDENRFKWLGRFDNVVNSGGIKLFPEQIESKLKPYIECEFIIDSVLDDLLGEQLIIVIESLENNIDFTQLFSKVLSKYERPKKAYFLDLFPRTENGKVKRKEILNRIKP
ncbi:MAG: AMP-binding protein [Moheibacter sp.]